VAHQRPPAPVIDIHAHFIPPGLIDAARAGQGFDGLSVDARDEVPTLVHREGYRYPIRPEFHEAAARLEAMDALGIDRALVSVSPTMYFYNVSGPSAHDHARATNDALAAHVADAPDRLAGLATLPMQAPKAAARELERAVTTLGFRGASVGPRIDETYLDDPRFVDVLETAQSLDVPVLVHPYYVGTRPGLTDFYLTNLIGNPLDSTICAARLILSGTLDRLTALRVALVHGGGFLPYQVGRLDHGHRVRPESKGCAHPPSSYLRRFVYDTITHSDEALAYLVRRVGADRVAFGTDLPFDMMSGRLDDQLGSAGLAREDRDRISSGTAMAWFGLA
jgi:aminocarboxymuconate-semialdehyde decarboxylase